MYIIKFLCALYILKILMNKQQNNKDNFRVNHGCFVCMLVALVSKHIVLVYAVKDLILNIYEMQYNLSRKVGDFEERRFYNVVSNA